MTVGAVCRRMFLFLFHWSKIVNTNTTQHVLGTSICFIFHKVSTGTTFLSKSVHTTPHVSSWALFKCASLCVVVDTLFSSSKITPGRDILPAARRAAGDSMRGAPGHAPSYWFNKRYQHAAMTPDQRPRVTVTAEADSGLGARATVGGGMARGSLH